MLDNSNVAWMNEKEIDEIKKIGAGFENMKELRQDSIVGGLKPEYLKEDLQKIGTGSDVSRFYDFRVYLTKVVVI